MGPESSGWTAALAASAIRRREISCQELVRDTLERLHSVDRRLNAFLLTLDEAALDRARQLDERLARGEDPGPMAGVPVALKDNLCLAGTPTTCGSRILEGFRPPYSATAVQRLEQAGAIVIGKTNMDEFAMGSSTENSAFGTVRNPWNLDCVPGGSSGGSAAAVAAGQAMAALGSDTGGSVRQPASFCGVVGLKPTYGRVSRYGLVAYASSLDQIGPLTRDVTDAALVMNAIAGPDPADSTCASAAPPDYLASLRPDVRGARVGLPREMFGHGVHPAIAQIVRQGVDQLESLGAEIVEVSLPTSDFALAVYYILAPAEASSNLARYDGVEYGLRVEDQHDVVGMYMATRDRGFGDEVKRRILMGTYALSAGYYDAYYLKAQKVRTLVRGDFARAFDHCDILASPTSPAPAFRVGEKAEDPMAMKLADVLTVPANIAGIPAISVPCGLLDGLPVGLQLMARPFDETTLLRFAYTYEQATGHHRQRPDR